MGITIRHSFNMGDLLSTLPGIRHICKKSGNQATIYQQLNLRGEYYPGATHPLKDGEGIQVCFNPYMFDMAKPLIEYQSYIKSLKEWKGEDTDLNFDLIRSQCFVNLPYGSINRWTWYLYPDMACDLSDKWLEVPKKEDKRTLGKIIINRTERYQNWLINYFFLKEYGKDVVFAGTPKEYELFKKQWSLDIDYLEVNDFLELAIAINSCKVFVGNQSMAMQIADGVKKDRVLEVCSFAQNVTGNGAGFYDFFHQNSLEYYVKTLFNR